MNSIQDCYTLNNGMKLPCVGFGDIQVVKDTHDIPRVVFGTRCAQV